MSIGKIIKQINIITILLTILFTSTLLATIKKDSLHIDASSSPIEYTSKFITDPLCIGGKLGFGNDIDTVESFSYNNYMHTCVLKENNLRLHFDDTSENTSLSYNDWWIEFNNKSREGDNYFALKDLTNNTTPFHINGYDYYQNYAEDYNFVLSLQRSTGYIGTGVQSPKTKLHLNSFNTPSICFFNSTNKIRLAGNETNFFISQNDLGRNLVFAILIKTTANLTINSSGNIGINTSTPNYKLDVNGAAELSGKIYFGDESTDKSWRMYEDKDTGDLVFEKRIDGEWVVKRRLTTSGEDISLPVKISSFSAKAINHTVKLDWTTESEINNLGFIMERSQNDEWKTIADYHTTTALKGQGNSSTETKYRYIDNSILPGAEYTYRLSDVTNDGTVNICDTVSVTLEEVPENTGMAAAYPNPFNPITTINYQLAKDGMVKIVVYDMLGNKIKSLQSEKQRAGRYNVAWNGLNESGIKVPSGTYIIRMIAGGKQNIQKVMLMK